MTLSNPGVPFPPPFLFAAGFLAGLAIERWGLRLRVDDPELRLLFVLLGWIGIAVGLTFTMWGLLTFFRARTAIIPTRPARSLVVAGPYRFSRNPMYLGLTVLYLGIALLFNVAWPILLLPIVLSALYLIVIRREERYLASAFGGDYAEYRRRVRRWL